MCTVQRAENLAGRRGYYSNFFFNMCPQYCTVIGARMSQWKWRETKQHPSRARSGHQISCSFVSLHFLCDILAPITVVPSTTPNHLDALIIKCAAAPHNWARACPIPKISPGSIKVASLAGPRRCALIGSTEGADRSDLSKVTAFPQRATNQAHSRTRGKAKGLGKSKRKPAIPI